MSDIRIVQYRTSPETTDQNAALIADVFAELAATGPDGLEYAAFRLADGVSYVHVVVVDGAVNPLATSPAFGRFQHDIAARCVSGPTPADASVVGSYRSHGHSDLTGPA